MRTKLNHLMVYTLIIVLSIFSIASVACMICDYRYLAAARGTPQAKDCIVLTDLTGERGYEHVQTLMELDNM